MRIVGETAWQLFHSHYLGSNFCTNTGTGKAKAA